MPIIGKVGKAIRAAANRPKAPRAGENGKGAPKGKGSS